MGSRGHQWSHHRSNSMIDLFPRRSSFARGSSPFGNMYPTSELPAHSSRGSASGSPPGGSVSPKFRMVSGRHPGRAHMMDWVSTDDVGSIYEDDVHDDHSLGCDVEVLEGICHIIAMGVLDEVHRAAAEMEYLVSSSQPKDELDVGGWKWSAAGAKENRSAIGGVTGLWDSFLRIIHSDDSVGHAMVCGAMSKLGFRNTYNVVNMMKHPGLLTALIELLEESHPIKVQKQAWRVLHNCCSGIDEVKVIICSHEGMEDRFVSSCLSEDEEVRRRAVSVIMHASSTDAAKPYLVKARIPETALQAVMSSDTEELATRIRATLASANMCGREERSFLTTAPEMLKEIVMVTLSALGETEYCGIKWSLAGVMLPLFNLSVSDSNKKALIDVGCVSLLLSLVQKSSTSVGTAHEMALRTLANLTFDPLATEQMIEQDAVTILGDVVAQSTGGSLKSKQVAQDLVFMLTGGQDLEIQIPLHDSQMDSDGSATTARPSHLMFSYSWLEKKRNVVLLADMMRQRGMDVWRDEEGSRLVKKMSGSSMDIMAEAIESAEFVVVFVSRAYRDSYNCKLEGKYAQIRERAGLATIIYVMMEEDYTPQSENSVDGWLGMMIGDSIWYKGWDPAFLGEAADAIEVHCRRGKTQCFFRTESYSISRRPSSESVGHGMPGGFPGFDRNASILVSDRVSDDGFGLASSSSVQSGSGIRSPSQHSIRGARGMDGMGSPSDWGHAVPLSSTATSSSANTRRQAASPFASLGNAAVLSRGPSNMVLPVYETSQDSSHQGFKSITSIGSHRSGRPHASMSTEDALRTHGSLPGGSKSFAVTNWTGEDPANYIFAATGSDGERLEYVCGRDQIIPPHLSFDPKPAHWITLGKQVEGGHHQHGDVERIGSEAGARFSAELSSTGARFGAEMSSWIAKHKLEGMYDVFKYHHIDEPEIVCLLTEDQIDTFTDKIGLRMRILDAIEAENKKRSVDGKQSVDSEDAISPVLRGVNRKANHQPTQQQSPALPPTNPNPKTLPSPPAINVAKIQTPVLIDFTVPTPEEGGGGSVDGGHVIDYTHSQGAGGAGGGSGGVKIQPAKLFGGLFGFEREGEGL